jgi:hypothetical protein
MAKSMAAALSKTRRARGVSGRLYDQAFDLWLETGHYASRPPAGNPAPPAGQGAATPGRSAISRVTWSASSSAGA